MELAMRSKVLALQADMLALPEEAQVDCPVVHRFAPGMYSREMFIPAGTIIIGKLHKHSHLNNISQGCVRVATSISGVQEFNAPCSFMSEPGVKRAVLALTDTIWTTYHPNPTDTQDLVLIEEEVIAESYEALAAYKESTCDLGNNSNNSSVSSIGRS
jgi:hypothetical protein